MIENRTDLGNARRLVAAFGDRLRWVPAWGTWLVWDGIRWRRDATLEAERLAKSTVRAIFEEADQLDRLEDQKALQKWAILSESEAGLRRLLLVARSEPTLPIVPEQLDDDPLLFVVSNGTLDLRTGILRNSLPEDLITRATTISWDPTATCPKWLSVLHRCFADDSGLVNWFQLVVGYTLTGDTSEQVLFFLFGRGANGKTVILEVIRSLLGEHGVRSPFGTFLEQRTTGPRNDLAALAGARWVYASEVAPQARFDEATLKSLTGGDPIAARFLYREQFTFIPKFKLWLCANHRPMVRGTEHAVWRRIVQIPFVVTIPEEERDPYLVDKLRPELPGILRWAVEGCLRWQQARLRPFPAAVVQATIGYREECDVIGGFLEAACELGAGRKVTVGALYAAYLTWAQEADEEPIPKRTFGMKLGERGLEKSRTKGARSWVGIGLKGDAETQGDAFSRESLHARAQEEVSGNGVTLSHTSPTPTDYELERLAIEQEST